MFSHSLKLIIPVYILSAISLLMMASISLSLLLSQLVWLLLGSATFLFFWYFNTRNLIRNRAVIFFLYLISLILLIIALFSPPIRGVSGWIPIGPFRFQPSELIKVVLLLVYAYFFSKRHVNIASWKTILVSVVYIALPFFLIYLQPDMGSALVLSGMWLGFLILSGVKLRHLGYGLILAVLTLLIAWNYLLAPYQKDRIISVFSPGQDPLGIDYNVIQSKIAVGSGGLWGKGFGQGTQVQLGFLPEAHNDFIFAAVIEEWGLLGGLIVLGAFIALCREIIVIGFHLSDNNYDRFICLGAVIILIIHFFINTGSALGLSPVIGLPFPFLSYGGSSLLANFIIISLINSIVTHS